MNPFPIISPSVKNYLLPAAAFCFLAAAVWFGIRGGKRLAYNERLVENGFALERALDYFFQDQARYPTAGEFASDQSFGVYVDRLAAEVNPAPGCAEAYRYRRLQPAVYELYACLSESAGGFGKGWALISRGPK